MTNKEIQDGKTPKTRYGETQKTYFLDKNGNVVNPLTGSKLEEWLKLPMNAPLDKLEVEYK